MKQVWMFLWSVIFINHVVAVEIQKDPKDEQVVAIGEQHDKNLYGSWLFNGGFTAASFSGINPHYRIAQGDRLLIQVWGGVDFQGELVVDPKGNIFIPKVGPVKVLGVKNNELNRVVLKSVKRVYKENVEAYVSLISTQKVKVFLSGLVKKPGLYEGESADSVLRFIDQAGGIREDIGAFRRIELKRNNKVMSTIDLYQFVNEGTMPITQLQDGDVIFVNSKVGEVSVEGEVGFSGRYELAKDKEPLKDIIDAVVATERATHVTLVESDGKNINARQFPIDRVKDLYVKRGASIRVSSQQRASNISVQVLGEHNSAQEVVLPWGATLQDVLSQIEYTNLSNQSAIQLYRQSIAERQKAMLESSLSALERNVLTTRSATKETAQLRKIEAETVLQWIERARKVEPKGQVLLTDGYDPTSVVLQQGDKIVVPSKKNLVVIHGDVLFATAVAYKKDMSVEDVLAQAGGVEGDIDDKRVLVMSPNGGFTELNGSRSLRDEDQLGPGDEVFILPEPDIKAFQITKDITQIMYQIAVSAAVVLAI